MKYVWRIENEHGIGPYRSCATCIDDSSTEDHPTPHHDKKIGRYICYMEYCGFESIYSLYDWFTAEEIRELQYEGFEIVKYEVGKEVQITAVGERQVLFVFLDEYTEEQIEDELGPINLQTEDTANATNTER